MRIYVACLASYNNGVLHGELIDAESDVDSMRSHVAKMLARSKFPNVTATCPWCEGDGEEIRHNSETGDTRNVPCPYCNGKGELFSAEEFAIHDYDDFPNMGEYPSLDDVAKVAEFIEDSDDEELAKEVLKETNNDVDDAQEMMDNYHGTYNSFRDYADEFADKMMPSDAPDFLKNYFDYESFARDLQHDYTVIEMNKGVAIFSA